MTAATWRVGRVEVWSPPLGGWLQQEIVTLRPGDDPDAMAAALSVERRRQVRIVVLDR
jgi:hypothetical protein